MRLKISLLLNLLFIHLLFAFTIKDIPDSSLLYGQSTLIKFINDHIEPYSQRWTRNWDYPVEKDSVKSGIMRSLSLIDEATDLKNQPVSILLKSLLWHYLYQLEVDSAFEKADSLGMVLMASYPDIPEAAWLRGVHLVRGSRINEGFRILDSLRIGHAVDNPDFLMDIKELSASCFLPAPINFIDTSIFSAHMHTNIKKHSMEESELIPQVGNWRIVEQMKKKKEVSLFVFGSVYMLNPIITLRYPDLLPLKLKLNLDKQHLEKVWFPLLFETDRKLCEAEMEIVADASVQKEPQADYLSSYIGNRFDVVKVDGNINPLHGISIRCYKRSFYRGTPGEFNAFAVIDLRLRKNRSGFYCKESARKGGNESFGVRYLVSMKSSSEVEDKAEIIFRNILNQFVHWE